MRHRVLTALIAAVALAGGFALNQATGSRWVGASITVLGAVWCVARSWHTTSWWRVVVVLALGGVSLPVSHRLAPVLGAWGSVALVTVALAVGVLVLVDNRGDARPRRDGQTTP